MPQAATVEATPSASCPQCQPLVSSLLSQIETLRAIVAAQEKELVSLRPASIPVLPVDQKANDKPMATPRNKSSTCTIQ